MNKAYSKNPDIIFRTIAGECILVPIKNNVGDMENIYSLNPVAARIWELIDGKNSQDKIEALLTEEFDVTGQAAGKDLQEFLSQLKCERIVEEV